jgi:hypothetical protein
VERVRAGGSVGRTNADERRRCETRFKRSSKHQLCLEHLLLEPLRDGVPMGGVGHRLPEGRAGIVQTVVKLTPYPRLDVCTLAARGCGHHRSKEGLGVGLEGRSGVMAELSRRRSALPLNAPTDSFHEYSAGTAGLAEDFAFNNVIGHDV